MADEHDQRRKELENYYASLPPEERRNRIVLEPAFRDAYNEITKAHQVVQVPKYFWDNWAPLLGPVATSLYLRLRQYCYYNPETGERRDWCWPKQETLAAQVGIKDPKTLRKALLVLESQGFIRREAQYRQNRGGGQIERTSDRYLVYFELPLVDADAVELLLRQARSGAPSIEASPRTGNISRYGDLPVENEPRTGKKSLHGAREKIPSRKKYLEGVLDNVNVATHTKERLIQTRDLAQQMLEQLGDKHSMGFYRKVAQTVPDTLIYRALSETKEARHEGSLSNAGAYFTSRIKQLAAEHRIKL